MLPTTRKLVRKHFKARGDQVRVATTASRLAFVVRAGAGRIGPGMDIYVANNERPLHRESGSRSEKLQSIWDETIQANREGKKQEIGITVSSKKKGGEMRK